MTEVNCITKKCSRCCEIKDISNFIKDKRLKSGYGAMCLACFNIGACKRAEKYRRKIGIEKTKDGSKNCASCGNSFLLTGSHQKLCVECKTIKRKENDKKIQSDKRARQGKRKIGSCARCSECLNNYIVTHPMQKYCSGCRNIVKIRYSNEASKKYRKENKQHVLLLQKNYYYNVQKNDNMFLFKRRVKCLIRTALRKKKVRKFVACEEILGCSYEKFRSYIESQFCEGMSWENRSEWHIDHIIPLASAKTEEDVIRLNHYTNLQPLWALDNILKSDKLDHPLCFTNKINSIR